MVHVLEFAFLSQKNEMMIFLNIVENHLANCEAYLQFFFILLLHIRTSQSRFKLTGIKPS